MSLERPYNAILKDLMLIPQIDASICKTLAITCISVRDDQIAEELLRKVRSHLALTYDEDSMYIADYYLEYVKDILDMTEDFENIQPISQLYAKVRGIYESLLFNRVHLIAALNNLERENRVNAMRENYWKN